MLKVDEFESAFRSAIKETYLHQDIKIKSVFLMTDLDAEAANFLDWEFIFKWKATRNHQRKSVTLKFR